MNQLTNKLRTAIDTNVLSALWSKEWLAGGVAQRLGNAKMEGGLVVERQSMPNCFESHALAQADCLMTLDPKRYEQDLRELKLICQF